MSVCFKGPKIGEKNFATTWRPASRFGSIAEKTSAASCSDESDDTSGKPCSKNTYGSSWSVRDRKNNEKQYNGTFNDSARTNDVFTKKFVLNTTLKLPPIQELAINSSSEDEALPNLKDLNIDSDNESINKIAELSLNPDLKPLAGIVTAVAKEMGLIVVKPPKPHDVLLYLGSPVFVRKSGMALLSKEVKLGWIIDVFGPAREPYYCVKPVNNGIELVHEGTELVYSPDHPRTAFLCLKREDNNRYTVLCSPHYPVLSDQRKNRPGGKDFWRHNSSGSSSPYRQLYRRGRRHASNRNRGACEYGNEYRNDVYEWQPIQPKHSYFYD